MGGGSKPQVVRNEPPAIIMQQLPGLFAAAQQAFGRTPTTGYPGQRAALPTQAQTEGQRRALEFAQGYSPGPGLQVAEESLINLAQGNIPGASWVPSAPLTLPGMPGFGSAGQVVGGARAAAGGPFQFGTGDALTAAITAALNPLQQRLEEQILPGITSTATAQGAYGGDRYGLNLANVIRDQFARPASDAIANAVLAQQMQQEGIRAQQYGQEFGIGAQAESDAITRAMQDISEQRQITAQEKQSTDALAQQWARAMQDFALGQAGTQLSAAERLPGLVQTQFTQGLQPAQVISGVGAEQQQQEQSQLDALLAAWEANAQAPWTGVQNLANIIYGGGGLGGTQTTQMARKSGMEQAIEGLLGAGMIAATMFT